jgi:hypothetical protein
MSRFETLSFTSASIPNGNSLVIDEAIPVNYINVHKVKVVPSAGTGTSQVGIFKRSTALAVDCVYNTLPFSGDLIDPVLNDGVSPPVEVNEGFLFPYEDLDNYSNLHISITNNGGLAQTYDVTIIYEQRGNPPQTIQTFIEFVDPLFWIPIYPQSALGTLAFNGSNQAVMTSANNTPNAGGFMGVASRFGLYPDPATQQIKLRAKFINMKLPVRAAPNQDQYWGIFVGSVGITLWGAVVHVDSSNKLKLMYENIDSGAIYSTSVSLGISPITSSLEIELTFGGGNGKTFGILTFDYNLDGAGWNTLAVGTGSFDLVDAYVAGLRFFVGCLAAGANTNTYGTLSEVEIEEGLSYVAE